jgi:enamine deaminase RidA (YjgF/YER057c/UK114 family)
MTDAEPSLPVPQGDYVSATRQGDLIFTSGMTPRRDGVLLSKGLVRNDTPLEEYREAVQLACGNALTAVQGQLVAGEHLAGILSFEAHSRLANFASAFLRDALGHQGIGARAAIGVATLPGNATVEIQLVAFV